MVFLGGLMENLVSSAWLKKSILLSIFSYYQFATLRSNQPNSFGSDFRGGDFLLVTGIAYSSGSRRSFLPLSPSLEDPVHVDRGQVVWVTRAPVMMRVAATVMTVVTVVFTFRLMSANVLASVILRRTTVRLRVDVQAHRSVKIEPLLYLRKGQIVSYSQENHG